MEQLDQYWSFPNGSMKEILEATEQLINWMASLA